MAKTSRYKTGAHTKHRLKYHLSWIPKYRKRVLKGNVASCTEELLSQCAEVNGWELQELAVMPDHVHLLLQLGPATSVAQAVQYLKGGSSRIIRTEFPELEEFLWGDSFWADGYFAETAGTVSESHIRRYIQEQTSSMP